MSATNAAEAANKSASSSSKKKKQKKKKAAANGAAAENGTSNDTKPDVADEEDEEETESQAPIKTITTDASTGDNASETAVEKLNPDPALEEAPATANGTKVADAASDAKSNMASEIVDGDTTSRLDAMQSERDNLRAEVSELRRQLETLREQHTTELLAVKEELEQSNSTKEQAETQYRTLLGKVNTIRSQLGDRLKADAAELEQAREKIESLESDNTSAKEENERLQTSILKLSSQLESQSSEIDSLRSRTSLSTNNWAKERDDLISKEAYIREEYEVAKQAMQDWEILATEERARREALEERIQGLEDQLYTQREAYERAKSEVDTQSTTVDGLQRALGDLQEERKRELRELVEQTQTQLDALRDETTAANARATELTTQLETAQKELLRTTPFEKEVKEKNLLIGKLRHEAVTLNEHLTKALRFLKRGKPEDNVDRRLVTNHFLHFLQLDRSDPKKFQVLQLIAALLAWDEQQKEQAGLLRGGVVGGTSNATTGSLRLPVSPFRRTPSTPALTSDFVPEMPGSLGRETLAELWSEFLEREAESGSQAGSSRRGSIARSVGGMRSPSLTGGLGLMTSPISERGPPLEVKRKESKDAGRES